MIKFIEAQDVVNVNDTTKYWDFGGVTSLTSSQVALSHWAAGGNNSITVNGLASLHANFTKDNQSWTNTFEASYGTQKTGTEKFQKSDDKLNFSSKYGIETAKHVYIAALFNFNSQFYYGYKTLENGTKVKSSGFMSPSYFIYSIGIDYKPVDYFAVYASPLTGKSTFINDTTIASTADYGLDANTKLRNELGAYIKFEFSKKIYKEITLESKLDFFSNYLKNPQNIDINWNMLLNIPVYKFLTVTLNTTIIYDDDIKIYDKELGRSAAFAQIKEVFGVGFSYTF